MARVFVIAHVRLPEESTGVGKVRIPPLRIDLQVAAVRLAEQLPNARRNGIRSDVSLARATEVLHNCRDDSNSAVLQVLSLPELIAAQLDGEFWVQRGVRRGLRQF